jgi:putative flavoprotein involved in K+ transport
MAWFDAMGVLSEPASQAWDLNASRRQTSLQLIGSDDRRSLDLNTLQGQGVRVAGRAIGVDGGRVYLADDLAATTERAEARMGEQLDRVDSFIAQSGLGAEFPAEERPRRVRVPEPPGMLDLEAEGVGAVLWATGYRREYPWLRVPVLDANGELRHDGGVTPQPGLYALGLRFMRRRNSSFLDGVGADAEEIAERIVKRMARRSRTNV